MWPRGLNQITVFSKHIYFLAVINLKIYKVHIYVACLQTNLNSINIYIYIYIRTVLSYIFESNATYYSQTAAQNSPKRERLCLVNRNRSK